MKRNQKHHATTKEVEHDWSHTQNEYRMKEEVQEQKPTQKLKRKQRVQ